MLKIVILILYWHNWKYILPFKNEKPQTNKKKPHKNFLEVNVNITAFSKTEKKLKTCITKFIPKAKYFISQIHLVNITTIVY